MLTLSLRPYYLPREFPTVVISCVYIPPGVNTNTAAELVAQNVHTMLSKYPDAPVLIMGDFNSCKLDCVLPSFEQYVDVPTRREKVLDLCYGNINTRFDNMNFTTECERLLGSLPTPEQPNFAFPTVEDVHQQLRRCKTGKAPGPDGITGRLLKNCALELSPVLHSLFNESLLTATVPNLWKTATIIPVPKKPRPSELNHYRPVALTSKIAKCLEKLVLNTILQAVCPQLDPYQFAYKAKRGTEDTVACLLHTLLQHLDSPGHYARILFVDFSSAFNTIQSHIMITKLHVPPLLIH
ncbi:Retrovirus-related Pol polyprotein from type-1 retrotransposable element R1 [Merluccius polli]|uniref:Retrovirus-related Pol polyprotein from type-1 retrotransposable element R1 n=1 Tax=Merluccius polli TaxID=89951 RepID=A0AA47MN05_MERPO|nr:Retrovirus-related Pol polyprotein from type-1 retrotransposable element R1 [Merluccius polli]